MEIRDNKSVCIIAPICEVLKGNRIKRILKEINKESRKVAIDLNYVQECSIEFIDALNSIRNKEIGVFNIPADIFVLFNVMNIDKRISLYVSEMDFIENTRQLINRKFAII